VSREWKPGDVAMAQSTAGASFLVVRTDTLRDAYWSAPKGWPSGVGSDDCDYRPLVVIDPEDRQQVDRLCDALSRLEILSEGWDDGPRRRRCADALREFANPTPPKPTEPTGLGAVVEDADGMKWILVYDHTMWQQHHDRATWRHYSELAVVRVLSEGVTL
jgi:hypothetical protein